MDDCIFCKISKGETDTKFLYEDDDILAFNDVNPSAPVHKLIIPKKHIKRLSETSSADLNLLGRIQLVAKQLAEENEISDNFKVVTNNGANAGQVVSHMHYHLMGGFKNKNKQSLKTSL